MGIYVQQLQSQYSRYFSSPLREKNSTTWLSLWKWDWTKILNLNTWKFRNICIWLWALVISDSEELQHVLKAWDIFLLFNSPVILICWFIQCIFDYIINASELLPNHTSECNFTWQENISLFVVHDLLGIFYKIKSMVEEDRESIPSEKI